MKVIDLFAGMGGWSAPFKEHGHEVLTLDNDPQFECDFTDDILEWDESKMPWVPQVVLASPPCEAFSVMRISKNWTKPTDDPPDAPISDDARLAVALLERTLELIELWDPHVWVIENPRAKMRKMPQLKRFDRYTVTYCMYGETHMKPTDLWGGFPLMWQPRKVCNTNRNAPTVIRHIDGVDMEFRVNQDTGQPCHQKAERGARTGVQGIGTAAERGLIPYQLADTIREACEWEESLWT